MEIRFSLEDLKKVVQQNIVPMIGKFKIFTFIGPIGAGKTTTIKEVFRQCGIQEVVKSPTFTYVNVYKSKDGRVFNHLDLYRIESLESFINFGFEEFLDNGDSFTFIEWPEVIEEILDNIKMKKQVLKIVLNYYENNFDKRVIQIN
jgi:tRNA threonylcarbamoyladenosine biosynthesis protein TsaE